jgi:hypothetical protein
MRLARLGATLEWAIAWLDRHRVAALTVAVVWIGLLVIAQDVGRPFWHDEIYTILGSELPVATLWRASRDGLDLSSPLNTILTRGVHGVFGVGPVATRLPALAGFLSAVIAVFLLVQRRSNTVIGLSAAGLLCLTPAWDYAFQARGYAITTGSFALALFGWSEAARGHHPTRSLALMAVSLAVGVWTHQFLVLAFLPIVVGEITRQIQVGRIDHRPWIALMLATAATTPLCWLAAAGAGQRATFWARPTDWNIPGLYADALGQLRMPILRLAAFLLGILAIWTTIRRARLRLGTWPRAQPIHEVAAAAVLVVLPIAGALLGAVAGVFTERYITCTVIAFPVVLPLTAWCLAPAGGAAECVIALAALLAFGSLATHTMTDDRAWQDPMRGRLQLSRALADGPVAVACGLLYLPIWYYAPKGLRTHAIYIADPATALSQEGSDTIDRGYLALSRWRDVPAIAIESFLATRRRFCLYACGSDWVLTSLRNRGATLTVVGEDPDGTLYEVKLE